MKDITTRTDSYKCSHWLQYPPGTEKVYSYFESRGGPFDECCFFGLQYYLKEYLVGNQASQLLNAQTRWAKHFRNSRLFNNKGWEYIQDRYHGRLPVSIKAVPEGTIVPVKNVMMTIENTDPNCYWLTNWLETMLVMVWYPCTVATQSREMKKTILHYLNKNGDSSLVDYKLHDFGFRGSTSLESASIGGAAHLVNFRGTDTFPGVEMAIDYYGADMPGESIPASEHSTITSWGEEHEVDAFANMLDKYPTGLVACVSDSYDIYRACREYWGTKLRDKVLSRDGVLVIRPDSGDPPEVVLKVLEILGEKFGAKLNQKDYWVLNPKVRIIQGDGIDRVMLRAILEEMDDNGWSADNIAFGSGGGLLQKVDRDTMKFAFKTSYVEVNGEGREVWKRPVTDTGKHSKKGRLVLVRASSKGLETQSATPFYIGGAPDELVEVFRDGKILKEWNFDEVRERAKL